MIYNSNKEKKRDRNISRAIMSPFVILTIQYFILINFEIMNTQLGEVVSILSKIVVGIFYLLALPSVLRKDYFKFIILYFVGIFIFIINYILFNENWMYLKTIIFSFFFIGLPSLAYSYSIDDMNVLMEEMRKAANMVFIMGLFLTILIFSGLRSIGTYSMSLSYYMLLPCIIYLNDFFDYNKIKKFIFFVISFIIILVLGSRGSIMCIGVFIFLKILGEFKNITYRKIILFIIILLLIIGLLIFFKQIMVYIYNLLIRYGIRSRTIRLFIEDITYTSGRDKIYQEILQEIYINPILGFGLAGDRRLLANKNAYVHNIIIEILGNFGIIFGGIINITLIFLIIKSLVIRKKKNYTITIIWISLGYTHLMVSSSYLLDFKFWILLGLLLQNNKNKEESGSLIESNG